MPKGNATSTTQPLSIQIGDEQAALENVYCLFPATRETIRRHGRDCGEFTKLALVILNQIVRPFTARWHKLAVGGKYLVLSGFTTMARRETDYAQPRKH
jgi:hypothetical protein